MFLRPFFSNRGFTWKGGSNGFLFFFYCITTLTLLFPTNPVTLVGRAACALSEAIGQWASDSDLPILCNCNDGSRPTRPQGFAQGSQSLALGTLLQTIMGHCECHKIIVFKCLWTDSCSKHTCNIFIYCLFGFILPVGPCTLLVSCSFIFYFLCICSVSSFLSVWSALLHLQWK